MTPTARTLKLFRDQDYLAEVVERNLPIPGRFCKLDFLGVIDLIAFKRASDEVIGVQATSASNLTARVKKALAEPRLWVWLQSKARRFLVVAWGKRGPRGKKKAWAPITREIVWDSDRLAVKPTAEYFICET